MKRIALQPGFTLLELLIVITVIGILAGIVIINWTSSVEKAKIVEVEKTARSLKDYIDVHAFDSKIKLKETGQQLLGKKVYKLANSDNIKVTSHFLGPNYHDVNIIFVCGRLGATCPDYFYNGSNEIGTHDDRGALMFYTTGSQTNCVLEETVFSSNSSATTLPDQFSNNKTANQPSKISTIELNYGGKTYRSNYCIIPLFKIKFELAT